MQMEPPLVTSDSPARQGQARALGAPPLRRQLRAGQGRRLCGVGARLKRLLSQRGERQRMQALSAPRLLRPTGDEAVAMAKWRGGC